MQNPALALALDGATFKSITLYKTEQGYQASLSVDGTSWHVCIAATPSDALIALFMAPPRAGVTPLPLPVRPA